MKPSLDSSLAKKCEGIATPNQDYDSWQAEYEALVKQYADCAIRHNRTVDAWPK